MAGDDTHEVVRVNTTAEKVEICLKIVSDTFARQIYPQDFNVKLVGGFNRFKKCLVSLDHFPRDRGEH